MLVLGAGVATISDRQCRYLKFRFEAFRKPLSKQPKWPLFAEGFVGYSWTRDSQLAFRSVLNDFTGDALTISDGRLFQNGAGVVLKLYWCRRIKRLWWWNSSAWLRIPMRVGWVKMDTMEITKKQCAILDMDIRLPRIRWRVRGNNRSC